MAKIAADKAANDLISKNQIMKKEKKKMLRDVGFDEEMDNVDEGRCATCGSYKVKYEDFKDSLSWKEFKLSKTCQLCQDSIFE